MENKDNIIIKHIHSNIIVGSKANGGNVSHKTYHNFYTKCKGDCKHCANTRICYQFKDEDGDRCYTSCMFCYKGNDWPGDMFAVITSS
jgi:hypothetical protein